MDAKHVAAMKANDDAHKAVLEGLNAGGVEKVIEDLREEHAAAKKVVLVGRMPCLVNLTR